MKRGIRCKVFHAQIPKQERIQALEDWKAGRVECIVATIAFGMGRRRAATDLTVRALTTLMSGT